MEFVNENLNTLSRKELQKLAKDHGVKANGKTIHILEQLQNIQQKLTIASVPSKIEDNDVVEKPSYNADDTNDFTEDESNQIIHSKDFVATVEETHNNGKEDEAEEIKESVQLNFVKCNPTVESAEELLSNIGNHVKMPQNTIVNNVTKMQPLLHIKNKETNVIKDAKKVSVTTTKNLPVTASNVGRTKLAKKSTVNTMMHTKKRQVGFGSHSNRFGSCANRKPLSSVSSNSAHKMKKRKKQAVKMAISSRGAEQMERFLKRQRLAREKRLQKKNMVAEFSRA
jgi:hypothetical protein